MKKGLLNSKGFTLIELMVVVAILGILASFGIPQVQKQMAKARQVEAKTNLAAIYTAEKAFFVEYSSYSDQLAPIGYAPEGELRYNTGFSSASLAQPSGYNGSDWLSSNGIANTGAYCAANTDQCKNTTEALCGGSTPCALDSSYKVPSATAFLAGSISQLMSGYKKDKWQITESKILSSTSNGTEKETTAASP
jgi:type IV pilus assembly protein PilA